MPALAAHPASVSLLEVDPTLEQFIPEQDRHLARRVCQVPAIHLTAGRWQPRPSTGAGDDPFALLVVDGALTSTMRIAGRDSARVLGPGDIFDPARGAGGLLTVEIEWSALQPTTLAALDYRYLAMARRWPPLIVALQQRLCDEANRMAVLAAIAHLPRVELRILALMWHLADRFGHEERGEGRHLPINLTHAQFGRLVGAQRPTVTIALQALRESGDLVRRDDGTWWLADASRDKLVA